ncbi:MAG: type IV pilus secretin PilQ [Deltaproteobacteria bacterium]|nr:type IV pilus secretin PilQ [Deltaproteobacteria bacterium]
MMNDNSQKALDGKWLVMVVLLVVGILLPAGCAHNKAPKTVTPPPKAATAQQYRAIVKVDVSEDNNTARVVLHANQPLTYTAVKHQFPLGVVLYFPDTRLEGVSKHYSPESSVISAIQTSMLERKRPASRVEVRLNRDTTYKVVRSGDDLVVVFSKPEQPVARQGRETKQTASPPAALKIATQASTPSVQPNPTAAKAVQPAEGSAEQEKPAVVTRIDFEMLDGGKSRVTVGTDRPVRYETQKVSDKKLLLKLLNTTIPKFQKRPLITTRFSGAVDRVVPVQTKKMGNAAAIAVELREPVAYRVYQVKNRCIMDFDPSSVPPRPMPAAEKAAWIEAMNRTVQETEAAVMGTPARKAKTEPVVTEQGKIYTGEKISLDFQDADIHNIFRILHEVSGKNFVIGDDVKGRVTLKLVNVPWDQVLDLILKMNKLGTVTEGNVVRIATLSTLEAEQKAMAQRKKAEEEAKELEPLVTEYIKLNYADAASVKTHLDQVKSSRGKVTIDEGTNMIILQDEKQALRNEKELIAKLDEATQEIATRQVMIEARIVEADSSFTRDLGVQWGGDYTKGTPGTSSGSSTRFFGGAGGEFSSSSPNFAVNLPPASYTSGLGFTFGRIAGSTLSLELRLLAMESQGKGRTISAPKILTLDNKQATIKQVTKIPFQVIEDNTVSIKTEEAGIELSVTPQITRDERIRMIIHAEKGAPDWSNTVAGNPAIDTNTADTELFVNDGQTIVIGGIITSEDTLNEARTPFLNKIPVLGWLFKQRRTVRTKAELLIFITPTIVRLEEKTAGQRS